MLRLIDWRDGMGGLVGGGMLLRVRSLGMLLLVNNAGGSTVLL
jgi:hypothetical protein